MNQFNSRLSVLFGGLLCCADYYAHPPSLGPRSSLPSRSPPIEMQISRRLLLFCVLFLGAGVWAAVFGGIFASDDISKITKIKQHVGLEIDETEERPVKGGVGGAVQRVTTTTAPRGDGPRKRDGKTTIVSGGPPTKQGFPMPSQQQAVVSSQRSLPSLSLPPLPALPPPGSGGGFTSVIPKFRHVIWKSKTLPQSAKGIDDTWRSRESGFTHIIHDDNECKVLADRFAAEREAVTPEMRFMPLKQLRLTRFKYKYNFSEVYENYQLNVMRSDVCRVLVVYFYGGFYMDLDIDFVKPLRDWSNVRWEATDLLLGMEYSSTVRDITNFFFAATERHPCLRILLEHLYRRGQDPNPFFTRERNTIHKQTGPSMWLYMFQQCRVPREYLFAERTLYHEGGRTSREVVGEKFFESPHTRENNYHSDKNQIGWYEPIPQLNRHALHGGNVNHGYGSNRWQRDASYGSWTSKEHAHKANMRGGEAVEAQGRRARSAKGEFIRPDDPDEAYLSLIRKHRFVVWQDPKPMPAEIKSIYADWYNEEHFTHEVLSADDCRSLFFLGLNRLVDSVPDALCGLLAIHLNGGGFYMHHSVRRVSSFLDWPDGMWAGTDVLVVGSGSELRTDLFGASANHPCTHHAIHALSGGDKSSIPPVTTKSFSDAMLQCSVDDGWFAGERRYALYGINGYTMGVRLEFLQSRGFPRSYAKRGGRYYPSARSISKLAETVVSFP